MNNQFGKKSVTQFSGKPWEVPKKKMGFSGPMNPEVMSFIMSCNDVRKSLCLGCTTQKLYDKNGKMYAINRAMTLEEVKNIVEEIRKANAV